MKKTFISVMILTLVFLMVLPASADEVIRYGDRGANVKAMQQMLRTLGFLEDKADGIYGRNTHQAVEYFLMYSGTACTDDEIVMDADSLSYLEYLVRVTEGVLTGEITPEDRELWAVCQPGEDGNEICWRHMPTIEALTLLAGGYPPQQMEVILLRRARQNWIDDMRKLYDEWALSDPSIAAEQKKDFNTHVKQLEQQWKNDEKKLNGDDLIEYLWEQYQLMEDMGVSLCFDLHTAEGS